MGKPRPERRAFAQSPGRTEWFQIWIRSGHPGYSLLRLPRSFVPREMGWSFRPPGDAPGVVLSKVYLHGQSVAMAGRECESGLLRVTLCNERVASKMVAVWFNTGTGRANVDFYVSDERFTWSVPFPVQAAPEPCDGRELALADELAVAPAALRNMLDDCALRRFISRRELLDAVISSGLSVLHAFPRERLRRTALVQGLDPDEFVASNLIFAVARQITPRKRP